jgi:hypothetical protein
MCTCSPLCFILVNLNELNIYIVSRNVFRCYKKREKEMYLGKVDAQ